MIVTDDIEKKKEERESDFSELAKILKELKDAIKRL
jgi:hypothetical protein